MQQIKRRVIEHIDPMCAPNLIQEKESSDACMCNSTTPATVTSVPNKGLYGFINPLAPTKKIYYCVPGSQNGT